MLTFVKSALKNKIFWYLASRYGTFAIQFLTSIWLAVKLDPYYFGLWSFILMISNIGMRFNWGIGNAIGILLVQRRDEPEVCRQYEVNASFMLIVAGLIPFAIALYDEFWCIPLFAKYQLGRMSYVVALIVAMTYLDDLFVNVLRSKNRILEVAIFQSLFPLLAFFAVVGCEGRNLLVVLTVAYAGSAAIALFLFVRTGLVRLWGRIRMSVFREIAGKGFYLFVYNSAFSFLILSTKFMLSSYFPVESFGHLSFAFNVAVATMMLLDSLMFMVFPKLVDVLKGEDRKEISDKLNHFRRIYIFAMSVMFLLMIAVFGVFISFLPKYGQSYAYFLTIAMAYLVYTYCFGYNVYILAQNAERAIATFAVVALGVNVMAIWGLVTVWHASLQTCLWGMVLAYWIYTVLVNAYAKRGLGVGLRVAEIRSFLGRSVFPAIVTIVFFEFHNVFLMFVPVALAILVDMRGMRESIALARQMLYKPKIVDI